MVPEVLHHCTESHVLILSDLGHLPDLSALFSNLGGFNPTLPLPSGLVASFTGDALSNEEVNYFRSIGTKLGRFFAGLHSAWTLERLLSSPDRGADYLDNPDMRDVVYSQAIKPVRSQLILFPDLISGSEANKVCDILEADFLRAIAPEERSFVLGDCWTGAVLVNTDSRPKVGVIDWEFASIGRGVHGDMAQLLAHLESFKTAAEHRGETFMGTYGLAVEELMMGLVETYRKNSSRHESKELRRNVRRSACLAHGAEIINCAFWKVWICEDVRCMREHGHTKVVHECDLVKKMVKKGIESLRMAEEDTQEVLGEDRSGGSGLLGLL